jgi:serine/threonine protein kinase
MIEPGGDCGDHASEIAEELRSQPERIGWNSLGIPDDFLMHGHATIVRDGTRTQMSPLETGEVLDHYRIESTVARSGMSILYRATDLCDGKQVAIKVPHAEMEADPVLLERFKREEEIGHVLSHPGIVKTYSDEARSRTYMVLEWVDGRLLRGILNEQRRLPVERAIRITQNICEALDTMHKHGIVHRDLKPENVMVDAQDHVKLIDFGIAMKEDARRLTYVNMTAALGTPDYVSPEQVKGGRGDQRSDIYSLGTMLYEMLTGTVPFADENALAALNARVQRDPTPPRELNEAISPELQEIIFRALEREPRHRYSTASEMAWELEHQELVGVEERTATTSSHFARRKLGRKWLLYGAVALVPLLLFGIMLLLAHH